MTAELPALESFADMANPPKTWQQGMEALLAGAIDYDESAEFVWACQRAAADNGYERRDWPCVVWEKAGKTDADELRESDKQFFRNMAAIADK